MDSDEERSRWPRVNENDFRNDPSFSYPGGGERIRRRASVRLEEDNNAQMPQDGSSGPLHLDNPNDQEGAEGKSRSRGHKFDKVKQLWGRESVAVQQERRTGRVKNRPENSNVKNVVLDYPIEEERAQLGLDLPIAGHPEADSNIEGKFEYVYSMLRTWSIFVATEQNREQPKPSLMLVIRAIAPDVQEPYDVYSLDRRSRRHLVEAVVSSVIFSGIFEGFDDENRVSSSSVDLWVSRDNADNVRGLESTFKYESTFQEGNRKAVWLRQLNAWRALTIGMLSQIYTDTSSMELVQEKVQSLSNHIMDLLESWLPAEQSTDIRKGLERLIKAFIELSRLLRQQRAYWFVTYKNGTNIDHPHVFDTKTMMDVNANDTEEVSSREECGEPNNLVEQKRVRFKIFPGLFKRGNADGLQYDDEVCYVKIRVKLLENIDGNTYF